jgi:predicted metal-dependent phosphoesterase TrpH
MHVATDLHGHTRYSDGMATAEAFVAARLGAGIAVLAVSDHDLLAAVTPVSREAAGAAIVIPAVEATSFVAAGTADAEQIHVLGYYPPRRLSDGSLERSFFYQRGLKVQAAWRDFVCEWLAGLSPPDRHGLDPEGELARLNAAEFPGLQTLLTRIVDRLDAQRPQVFRHFIRSHVRFWTDHPRLFGWSPEELIDALRADGAVDVVAHPARYRDKERLARVLLGASGVEVYTSRHRPEWAACYRQFAEQHGKLWTASADDHGRGAYTAPPCGTPPWVVERLLDAPVPPELRATAPAHPLPTPRSPAAAPR